MSHKRWCIFMAAMAIAAIPVGLYVNQSAYILTPFCGAWAVYHGSKWLRGEPDKGVIEEARDAFKKFYDDDKEG